MRARRWLVAGGIALVAPSGACAYFARLDEYTASNGDAAVGDAGSGDAVGDAPGDTGPLGLKCTDVDALFCADFDEANNLIASWITEAPHGQVVIDPNAYTSPHNSVSASLAVTPDAGTYAILEEDFKTVILPTTTRLAFDMRLDAVGPSTAVVESTCFRATTDNSEPQYCVDLLITAGASSRPLSIVEDWQHGNLPEENYATRCPFVVVLGSWNHYDLSVDLTNLSSASASLFVNGSGPCVAELGIPADAGLAPSYWPQIQLGLPFADAQYASTWAAHDDSVVFWAE